MTRSFRKLSTFLALAGAAAVLAACSIGRFAYNNASPAVTYLVDDYFDLSGDQENFVRERFARASCRPTSVTCATRWRAPSVPSRSRMRAG